MIVVLTANFEKHYNQYINAVIKIELSLMMADLHALEILLGSKS